MANLKAKSTGKIFHKVDSQLVAILCEAMPDRFEAAPLTKADLFPMEPAKPVVAKWSVGVNNLGIARLFLTTPAKETIRFSGDPDKAVKFFEDSGFGRYLPIPVDVFLSYQSAAKPLSVNTTEEELRNIQDHQLKEKDAVRFKYPSNI